VNPTLVKTGGIVVGLMTKDEIKYATFHEDMLEEDDEDDES